jgi:hypothetical protein
MTALVRCLCAFLLFPISLLSLKDLLVCYRKVLCHGVVEFIRLCLSQKEKEGFHL